MIDERKWADDLTTKDVQEFSFYPHAYTPMEKELEITLPEIDLELGEEKEEKKEGGDNGSSSHTLSLTLGGITLGLALGAGATYALAPETMCVEESPSNTTMQTSQTNTTPTPPTGGTGSTGTQSAAATETTEAPRATSTPTSTPQSSADGTI